jgi:hypothetical protein
VILLYGILYAGLNPFHAPANQVSWVAGSNAVRLGEHGTLLASGPFPPSASGERSIEIWLKPSLIEDSNTLLAFYDPAGPHQLWFSQSEADLRIHTQAPAAWRSAKTDQAYIADAFRDGQNTFWTLTIGPSGSAVYRNGALVGKRRSMRLESNDLSGQLVVGNSPISHESWSGVLSGLAIYDTALNGTQVARHYTSWKQTRSPAVASDDACIALYLFNEHSGTVIHNKVGRGNDLFVPPIFLVLRQTLLDPVWNAFTWSPGFWEDAVINIAGFIPFGCCFCAYFSIRKIHPPIFKATLLGSAVSLSIEILQSHLPTRDSSMSDVITNAVGSLLGALAYRGMMRETLDAVVTWTVRVLNRW